MLRKTEKQEEKRASEDEMAATILKEWTNEIVFYNQELDMYVWGVTHYGTSWDYVLTNIELNSDEGKGERKDE